MRGFETGAARPPQPASPRASKPPRLVATDLDGTLVRSDGSVSAVTRDVLSTLDHRGVPVVIVTARPLRWMDDLWPIVGEHGLAIVSNGAVVYDVASRTARETRGIEREAGLLLADAIRASVPDATFAIECLSGILRDPDFREPDPVPEGSPVGPLAEIWQEPALKVLVRHRDEAADPTAFREAVARAVGVLATPTWSVPGLVEISAAGVTKASALVGLAAELGVDAEEVVAFGDMPNDLPMLEWAGTSYAMAGAHPDVIAAADHVAPGNDDDGVARVLAELYDL